MLKKKPRIINEKKQWPAYQMRKDEHKNIPS